MNSFLSQMYSFKKYSSSITMVGSSIFKTNWFHNLQQQCYLTIENIPFLEFFSQFSKYFSKMNQINKININLVTFQLSLYIS